MLFAYSTLFWSCWLAPHHSSHVSQAMFSLWCKQWAVRNLIWACIWNAFSIAIILYHLRCCLCGWLVWLHLQLLVFVAQLGWTWTPYLCLSGPTLYVCMSRRMTCCSSVNRDDVHVLLLMVTSFECTTKISRPWSRLTPLWNEIVSSLNEIVFYQWRNGNAKAS